MRKVFEIGGIVSAAVSDRVRRRRALYWASTAAATVRDSLQAEQIVGSEDMSPTAIAAEAKEAGLPHEVSASRRSMSPESRSTLVIAPVRSRSYMRIHALESSGGLTYAQMGRFATADGSPKGTNDSAAAQKDADGQPMANAARNTWVTETALATALYASYMAEKTALFGIVVGIALLLTGFGFAILAIGGALRNPRPALGLRLDKHTPNVKAPAPVV